MSNKSLLLVEDNPSDEKLTRRAFAKSGVSFEVFVVRDGAEALEYLLGTQRGSETASRLTPTLLLLDLKLPRVDGFEVLRRVRADERTRLMPVVVLTASAEEQDVLRAYELGANAYLRKPVDFLEFAEAARIIGSFWFGLNVPLPASR
jgi:two-component system, response regulator